jgi:hypothetical protein
MADDAQSRLPLLFLDVDGPVLPFAAAPTDELRDDVMDSQLARLDRSLGPRLLALPCRLIWATAWEDDANTEIAPRIGLGRLPVVAWPDWSDERVREDTWFGLHWKTRTLVEWAAGRDFAWVDDEITEPDRDWVAEHHAGRALLHRVDSSSGLADDDFLALEKWLKNPPDPTPAAGIGDRGSSAGCRDHDDSRSV